MYMYVCDDTQSVEHQALIDDCVLCVSCYDAQSDVDMHVCVFVMMQHSDVYVCFVMMQHSDVHVCVL